MSPEELQEYEEMKTEFSELGLIYAPGSIYHGQKLHDPNRMPFDPAMILKIELARLQAFIEYLFGHSEHCDHILFSEAYEEFQKWEHETQVLNSINK